MTIPGMMMGCTINTQREREREGDICVRMQYYIMIMTIVIIITIICIDIYVYIYIYIYIYVRVCVCVIDYYCEGSAGRCEGYHQNWEIIETYRKSKMYYKDQCTG